MAASAVSEVADGPVLNLINKRLRALRKKYNRIIQMEEGVSQGKPINKEQEDVLRSKSAVVALIDELEKLRQPLSSALQEELSLALQRHQISAAPPLANSVDDNDKPSKGNDDAEQQLEEEEEEDRAEADENRLGPDDAAVEDLLNLLYFGCLFDVKPQSDFASTMLTRTHERGCCLTYDYVTDDATDLLGERDLDMISMLGGLVISRPLHSTLSHKNALRTCVEHAKLWLANSDEPIGPQATVSYAALRERLNKILASDYFTTTPEMKAPVEVAAAAGKYAPSQVLVPNSTVPSVVPVQVDVAFEHYQQKDEEVSNIEGQETVADQSGSVEEFNQDESDLPNAADGISIQQEQHNQHAEAVEPNQRDLESKEQQYIPRRNYQNQRGGGRGGRRGYSNGRGGRSGRSGGGYQNGRNQYYEQPGNYYPRNYYNSRGRGGRSSGGHTYSNNNNNNYHNYNGPATHGSHVQAE